jgi:multidrug transporter EmrE-like cation transporter
MMFIPNISHTPQIQSNKIYSKIVFQNYFTFLQLPTVAASKVLSPEAVSAISGLGIVIIILLSYFFLKEKLYVSDIVFAIIIVICIYIICSLEQSKPITYLNITTFYILTFSPFLLLIPAVLGMAVCQETAILFCQK